MKNSDFTVHVIEPDEGHWLTQASDEIPIQERIFSKICYLAVNDSADNWKEITSAEYENYQIDLEQYQMQQEENESPEQEESNE